MGAWTALCPTVPILIGDDSLPPRRDLKRANVETVVFPPDVGVSTGRNALVQLAAARGYRYVFVQDDDYVVPRSFPVCLFQGALEQTNASVVGANRCEAGSGRCHGAAAFLRQDTTLHILPNKTRLREPVVSGSVAVDFVQQVFFARVQALLHNPWDPILKNNDHYDFFLSLKHDGHEVRFIPYAWIKHDRTCDTPPEAYTLNRRERWERLVTHWFRKWGLDRVVAETGDIITIANNRGSIERNVLADTDERLSYSAVELANQRLLSGWNRLDARTEAVVAASRKTNTCVRIRKVEAEATRRRDRGQADQVPSFSVTMSLREISPACAHRLQSHRIKCRYTRYPVHVIVPFKSWFSEDSYMRRFLQQPLWSHLDRLGYKTCIIVGDMSSGEETKWWDMLASWRQKHPGLSIHVAHNPRTTFSRSEAVVHALKSSQQLDGAHVLTAVLDASVLLSLSAFRSLLAPAVPGLTAHMPIVYRNGTYREQFGHWNEYCYGILAADRSDILRCRAYDTSFGNLWGGEDIRSVHALQACGLVLFRERLKGAVHHHVHHSENPYYSGSKVTRYPLPMVPVSSRRPPSASAMGFQTFDPYKSADTLLTVECERSGPHCSAELLCVPPRLLPHLDGVRPLD